MVKRASYRDGIAWIALNDNAGSDDGVEDIAGYISTCLLADLFEKNTADVAKAILRYRQKHIRESQ
jgi:hypothetical protein